MLNKYLSPEHALVKPWEAATREGLDSCVFVSQKLSYMICTAIGPNVSDNDEEFDKPTAEKLARVVEGGIIERGLENVPMHDVAKILRKNFEKWIAADREKVAEAEIFFVPKKNWCFG